VPTLDRRFLEKQPDPGVRLVALSLLTDASDASSALGKVVRKHGRSSAEADEALHDFRVALRRLRSWLRTFRTTFRPDISRKQRRRLGELFDATGAVRDATVHLQWLSKQRARLGTRQRPGYEWLNAHLEKALAAGWSAALTAARRFDAKAIVGALNCLQVMLGTLHDGHVLEATIARESERKEEAPASKRKAGLLALQRRLHQREVRTFAKADSAHSGA